LVSPREASAISHGREGQSIREPVPYKEICLDRCMQAVLLTTFGGNTAFFIFLHYGPTFINQALGLDITETGFATALPYALCLILKFIAGPIFDHTTSISEKNRMIMFASLSQGVMMMGFFVLSQVSNKLVAQIAYTAAVAFNGLNIVGSIKCAQVWSRLFLGVGFFVLVCNIPFLFLASSEPAPWTKSAAFRAASSKSAMLQSMTSVEKLDSKIHPETPLRGEVRDLEEALYQKSEKNLGLRDRSESTDDENSAVHKRFAV
ncbi:hypothetical protein COOONC_15528, partial [Cooperia oncophora]